MRRATCPCPRRGLSRPASVTDVIVTVVFPAHCAPLAPACWPTTRDVLLLAAVRGLSGAEGSQRCKLRRRAGSATSDTTYADRSCGELASLRLPDTRSSSSTWGTRPHSACTHPMTYSA